MRDNFVLENMKNGIPSTGISLTFPSNLDTNNLMIISMQARIVPIIKKYPIKIKSICHFNQTM